MSAAELRRAEQSYRKATGRYDVARERRNAAVRAALTEGLTHAQVSDATGLTRGRIGQIANQ